MRMYGDTREPKMQIIDVRAMINIDIETVIIVAIKPRKAVYEDA